MSRLTALVLAGTIGLCATAGASERYDIVIAGGIAMDPESGLQAPRNIGVRDGKIAAISAATLAGEEIIDARGRVVAPGFIDMHSHAHNSLLGGRVQAFDGVTTAIEAEAGQLPVDLAYANAAREGRAINYGYTASWGAARMVAISGVKVDGTWETASAGMAKHEWAQNPASEQQMNDIMTLVERGLDQGAVGIGLTLGYAPGATQVEILRLSRLAARRRAPIFVHMRSGVGAEVAFQEVIANAVTTGAHWHICHAPLDSVAELPERLEAVRRAGIPISAESLGGWQGGSTWLNAQFLQPDNMKAQGRRADSVIYYGRRIASYEELARLQKEDPSAIIFTVNTPDADEKGPREQLSARLKLAGAILSSDAMPWTDYEGKFLPPHTWPLPQRAWAHPRSASTYLRVIQKYVVEWKLMTLMEVLRAGSLNPALAFERELPQFRNKGRLKVGADADLVVFDPARINAGATYEQPAVLTAGIEYSLVNGKPVIRAGRLDEASFPGKPIRLQTVH